MTIRQRAQLAIERQYAQTTELNPGSSKCAFCDDMGFVGIHVEVGHPLFGYTFLCPCGISQRKKAADPDLELGRRFADPRVPDKYKAATFDTFVARCTQLPRQMEGKELAYKFAKKFAYKRLLADTNGIPKHWLVLAGDPGVGKTSLMAATANYLSSQGFLVLWQDANALVRAITNTYDNRDRAEPKKRITSGDILDAAQKVPILCIDDMGDPDDFEPVTKHTRAIFYDIIRERHINKRTTFVTHNLNAERFLWMWGRRINRRIHESGIWIDMTGDDLSTY